MKCLRCGDWTERFMVDQRYCTRCEREVQALIAADTERRARVVWRPKVLTPFSGRSAA